MSKLEKIKEIVKTKDSKICLSVDVSTLEELYNIINELGDYICVLKIHHDIISDFNVNLQNTIDTLINLKNKHNFLIWEDRKFADIGMVMKRQVETHIIKWADLISVHPISGFESVKQIPEDIGIILIGELSSTGNLIRESYTLSVIEMCENLKNCVGIVCQRNLKTSKLIFTPGISLSSKGDNMGQKYSTIDEKQFSDIFVIGRGILNSDNRKKTVIEYNHEINRN